jgi:hypothetical protein
VNLGNSNMQEKHQQREQISKEHFQSQLLRHLSLLSTIVSPGTPTCCITLAALFKPLTHTFYP